jgi:hypothetical protein
MSLYGIVEEEEEVRKKSISFKSISPRSKRDIVDDDDDEKFRHIPVTENCRDFFFTLMIYSIISQQL